jgi:putative ABC transport system permease protein
MTEIHQMNLINFSAVYILLLFVLAIMKKCKVNQSKLLLVASIRMTVQLVLAGLVLTFIIQNPHPVFTVVVLCMMTGFAMYTILSRNKEINPKFKVIVACSLGLCGMSIVAAFITIIVGVNFFNPQYTIPISGMILGNAMTGVGLGLKTFNENIKSGTLRIETLINIGVQPSKILMPFVNRALETALLPTLNSMLGMGIIFLPGMMTGQILSGTMPMTAIMYQIAVLIAISTVTCLAVFCSLYFGSKTLYNKKNQMLI